MPQKDRKLAPTRRAAGVPELRAGYVHKKRVAAHDHSGACGTRLPQFAPWPRRPTLRLRPPRPAGPMKAPKTAKAAAQQSDQNFKAALGGMTRNVEMIMAGKLVNEGRILRCVACGATRCGVRRRPAAPSPTRTLDATHLPLSTAWTR